MKLPVVNSEGNWKCEKDMSRWT